MFILLVTKLEEVVNEVRFAEFVVAECELEKVSQFPSSLEDELGI
jgi:hypothetical protein